MNKHLGCLSLFAKSLSRRDLLLADQLLRCQLNLMVQNSCCMYFVLSFAGATHIEGGELPSISERPARL